MIGNHQYAMANGHSSSLLAPTGGESAVLSGQVSVPRTTGGMRRLDEGCPQPGIALGGLPALALAPALVGARTHPRPRGQVPIRGEAAHVRADLGQYCLRRTPSHPRDCLQSLNGFSERRIRSAISALSCSMVSSRKSMCASCWATRKRWCAQEHPRGAPPIAGSSPAASL
jgi:hypothetical protein